MRRFGRHAAALAALGMTMLALQGGHAAAAPAANSGGVFGADKGPVDITADSLEVIDAENKAIWRGNVEAIQGLDRLRTPVLTVFFAKTDKTAPAGGTTAAPKPTPTSAPAGGAAPQQGVAGSGFGSIERMEAEGPVYYVTPNQNARGDHATYVAAENSIVMTGNVVVVQDKNVVQGDKLTIDTVTNHSVLVSKVPGRAAKRVRGVFYQNKTQQPAGAAAPAAQP